MYLTANIYKLPFNLLCHMYHIKKEPSRLERLLLPGYPGNQYFHAESIKDFLENKEEVVEATEIPIILTVKYQFPAHTIAFIDFGLVYYHHLYTKTGEIHDFNSLSDPERALKVIEEDSKNPYILSQKKRKQLEDGMRLYQCVIGYWPRKELVWLVDYQTGNPPGDRYKESERGLVLRPAQAFSPV